MDSGRKKEIKKRIKPAFQQRKEKTIRSGMGKRTGFTPVPKSCAGVEPFEEGISGETLKKHSMEWKERR